MATNNKKRKIAFVSHEIIYWNDLGEEDRSIFIRPATVDKLEEVKLLQEKLIADYVNENGCLGGVFALSSVRETMKQLADLIPVIGQSKPGFEIEPLLGAGDFVQLGQIFFSESITAEMKAEGIKIDKVTDRPMYHFPQHRFNPTPSAIARIHDLPFFDKFQDLRDEKIKEILAEQERAETESNHREAVTAT